MFSKEALENVDNIDNKISQFIETFPAWERKYDTGFGGISKHANRGTITRCVKGNFEFESGGRRYVLYLILISIMVVINTTLRIVINLSQMLMICGQQ